MVKDLVSAFARSGGQKLLLLLVLQSLVAQSHAASCTAGPYNYNIGLVEGTDSTNTYDFNFCQTLSPTAGQVPCNASFAVNAYQYTPPPAGTTGKPGACQILGANPVVTPLSGVQGYQVYMSTANLPIPQCKAGPRQTSLSVTCGKAVTTMFTITESPPKSCNYTATFPHPSGCSSTNTGGSSSTGGKHHPSELSPGSIFLIIFFVTAVVYVVAGFIVNWKVRGLTLGVEAIPNVSLWQQVPGLVVDGVVFTKNKVMSLFGRGYTQL